MALYKIAHTQSVHLVNTRIRKPAGLFLTQRNDSEKSRIDLCICDFASACCEWFYYTKLGKDCHRCKRELLRTSCIGSD